jgi:hypothetical protein
MYQEKNDNQKYMQMQHLQYTRVSGQHRKKKSGRRAGILDRRNRAGGSRTSNSSDWNRAESTKDDDVTPSFSPSGTTTFPDAAAARIAPRPREPPPTTGAPPASIHITHVQITARGGPLDRGE